MTNIPKLTGKKQGKGKPVSLPESTGDSQSVGRNKAGQFIPGVSGNPAGRPVGSLDPLKEIGKKIAEERIRSGLSVKQRRTLEALGIKVEDLSIVESIMYDWAISSNVMKQEKFIERTYGKTPNVNLNQNSSFDFMKHADKFTDSELEAIRDGADPLEIYSSKIPDTDDVIEAIHRIRNGENAVAVLKEMFPGIFGGVE